MALVPPSCNLGPPLGVGEGLEIRVSINWAWGQAQSCGWGYSYASKDLLEEEEARETVDGSSRRSKYWWRGQISQLVNDIWREDRLWFSWMFAVMIYFQNKFQCCCFSLFHISCFELSDLDSEAVSKFY